MMKYFTPREVAQELRVTERTVYEWLTTGKLRGMRAGTRWRIRPEDVERFLQRFREAETSVIPTPAEEHAARVDALMGRYATVPFSSEDLFRERQQERRLEERRWLCQ